MNMVRDLGSSASGFLATWIAANTQDRITWIIAVTIGLLTILDRVIAICQKLKKQK